MKTTEAQSKKSETKNAFDAARDAVVAGEAAALSARTMNKRWAAYFAAETALKAVASWA